MDKQNPKQKRIPVIDYNRCTGQGICVEVCPEDIFEIRNLDQIEFCEETKATGFCPEPRFGTKDKRSYPVSVENCTECGECVDKCPEKAITLIPNKKQIYTITNDTFKLGSSIYGQVDVFPFSTREL